MKLLQPVRGQLSYDGIVSQKFNDQTTNLELLEFYHSLGLIGHNGIDFYKGRGEPIYAAHDGIVTYAQDCGSTGGLGIKIKGDGFYTLYFHNDEILVSKDENVSEGQIIAKMGNSGSGIGIVMGVHLHFGLYFLNPDNTIKDYNNGFQGAVDPWPYFINENNMLKIIGDKRNGRQYVVGIDDKLRWIFNETILNELYEAGIVNKFEVDWRDNIDNLVVGDIIAVIK